MCGKKIKKKKPFSKFPSKFLAFHSSLVKIKKNVSNYFHP